MAQWQDERLFIALSSPIYFTNYQVFFKRNSLIEADRKKGIRRRKNRKGKVRERQKESSSPASHLHLRWSPPVPRAQPRGCSPLVSNHFSLLNPKKLQITPHLLRAACPLLCHPPQRAGVPPPGSLAGTACMQRSLQQAHRTEREAVLQNTHLHTWAPFLPADAKKPEF